MDVWAKHFEEKGVIEPEQSSQFIIAHLLGAKTKECLERKRLTEFLSYEKTEQWAEENVEELRFVETRRDTSGRPRFCILQKASHKDHKLDQD
uniref:HemK methyltransferase family member 1 n=1 Tax=Nothobranchius kuhntae TaxID=321403 RepID=A0A1A8K3I1_NOTKU